MLGACFCDSSMDGIRFLDDASVHGVLLTAITGNIPVTAVVILGVFNLKLLGSKLNKVVYVALVIQDQCLRYAYTSTNRSKKVIMVCI